MKETIIISAAILLTWLAVWSTTLLLTNLGLAPVALSFVLGWQAGRQLAKLALKHYFPNLAEELYR